MDIKTSTKACEGYLADFVSQRQKSATVLQEAVIAIFNHVHEFDEVSLLEALTKQVSVYGTSKEQQAFNMLKRLSIPFSEKTGKKLESDKVGKCKENWSKFKAELSGDTGLTLTEWYDAIKGKSTDKTTDQAKAEKAAAKRQKVFEEVQAERRLTDPVAAKVAEYEAQLRAAYDANPAQAMAMAEADINQLRNSIGSKIAEAAAA